jgi:hypothetical protein
MSNKCGVTLTQNIHHMNKWTENMEPCSLDKKGGLDNGNVVSEKKISSYHKLKRMVSSRNS